MYVCVQFESVCVCVPVTWCDVESDLEWDMSVWSSPFTKSWNEQSEKNQQHLNIITDHTYSTYAV